MATESDLVRQLRVNVGVPSEKSPDGMSDPELSDIVARTLEEFSQHLPKRTVEYTLSVAGQQNYVLSPVPDFVLKLFEKSSASLNVDSSAFPDISGYTNSPGLDPFQADPNTSIFLNPSMHEVSLQAIRHLRRMVGTSYTYDKQNATLMVLPCPGSTGARIYYVGGYIWTVDILPSMYVQPFLKLLEAKTLKVLVARRATLASGSSAGITGIYSNLGLLKDLAKEREDEALMAIQRQQLSEGLPYC